MKRTNIHLSEQQLELLKEISKETGLTVAEHIRRAIDEYLEKRKKDANPKVPQVPNLSE